MDSTVTRVMDFMKGEKPESTQALQFRAAARGGTGDPDVAIIDEARQEQN